MGANIAIITLGALGAVCSSRSTEYTCHLVIGRCVAKELVKDTTGAGDAFIGALAHNFAQYPEKDVADHVLAANEVAAHSVQRYGTQSSFPYADEIKEEIQYHPPTK